MEHHLLFKPDDWTPLAWILGAPLFGAFFNGVFGKRLGKNAVRIMALAVMGVSFAAAVYTFLQLHDVRHAAEATFQAAAKQAGKEAPEFGSSSRFTWLAWKWLSMPSSDGGGRLGIDAKFMVDELSGVMMLVITGIGFLIHLYSTSYMAKDPGYHRFFAYLNLFIFSMLVLVLGANMPLLFVGWEGVGLCSYLLIGFWFDKEANAAAGRKAFVANRIGDVGMIGGMFLLAYYAGGLDWDTINHGSTGLLQKITLYQASDPAKSITVSAATLAGLAIFLGCTGKSAQIPLYVWLPDAMAGPTPVSALIHAATMVTSGLYLICRLNVVFTFSPFAMAVVATVGALTALFAATIGLVQNDIKKVLAYSTVSQLGFMFLGVGSGAFAMGFFHVFTHAFFKAALFLGSGSVIHAMHARIHDDVKSQDMRFMGGLKKYMPWTYASMGAGTLAIAGMPLFSGFFSKDGILFHVFSNRVVHPFKHTAELLQEACTKNPKIPACANVPQQLSAYWEAPKWLGPTLFTIGIVAATCTAFYMFRLMFLTFWGEFKGWKVAPEAALAVNPFENEEPLVDEPEHEVHGGSEQHEAHVEHDADAHGHDAHASGAAHEDAHGHDAHDDHGHHHEDLETPGAPPAEAPWTMALPVAILAVFAVFAGWLYAEPFHVEPLGHWLGPIFHEANRVSVFLKEGAEHLEKPLMLPGVLAFVVGSGLAWFWYVKGEGRTPAELAAGWPRLHRAALNKWYVDELYDATIIEGTDALADGASLMDAWVVDGILAKLTSALASGLGAVVRAFQNGVVHVYAAGIAIGALGLFVFFGRPHADVVTSKQGDQYVLEATPGLGYEYKWELDGKAEPAYTTGEAALKRSLVVKQDEKKSVKLTVKNAFGRETTREVQISNPKPAPSSSALGLPGAPAPGGK
jgi:NADH-quinone oxidoreductase subunit L